MASDTLGLSDLEAGDEFTQRHVGPNAEQEQAMLESLGLDSLDELIEQAVPASIRLDDALAMAEGVSETQALAELQGLARRNKLHRSFIGMGYYDTHVPGVILRNVLENPAWYTAYTPYQPGDRPGASRSAAELPADGDGSDRHGAGQRLAAG